MELTKEQESAAAAPPGPARDERPLWKRALPFVIAVLLVAWVVRNLELRAFLQNLQSVNHFAFLGFVAVFTVANLAADSVATAYVYRRTIAPIGTGEFFLIRGASYFPSLLNHHVGQAWLTWYLSRVYKAPLSRTAGATMLVYATTFGSLFVFGAFALLFDHAQQPWLAPTIGIGVVAGLGYLVLLHLKPARLANTRLLAPLFEAGVAGHLKALALRMPHAIVLFLGSWLPYWFFGVKIPVGAALAYVPVLMVVQALPITPQGVGTRDVFAQQYFAHFGPGTAAQQQAAVAATTLTFVAASIIFQILISVVLMRRAMKALASVPAAAAEAAQEKAAS